MRIDYDNTISWLTADTIKEAIDEVVSWWGAWDVVWPASAVDSNVVLFDWTTGKIIKDWGLTLSWTNTWDQTSIVWITWTKAEFDTALTDDNFAYLNQANTFTQNQTISWTLNVNWWTFPTGQLQAKQTDDTTRQKWILLEADADDSILAIWYNSGIFSLSPTFNTTWAFKPLAFFTSNLERLRIDVAGDTILWWTLYLEWTNNNIQWYATWTVRHRVGGSESMRLSNAAVWFWTTTLSERMNLNGAIRLWTTTNTNAWTIRWNGTNFQWYDWSGWVDLDIAWITASSTDTLTNKTFDANGTWNSLSNVDVADLANWTDWELITWNASGVPATVAVWTATHVLTSNWVWVAPTFQAPAWWGWVSNIFDAQTSWTNNFSTTITLIAFATENIDTDSNYNTTTSQFTAPSAGEYYFYSSVYYTGVTDADSIQMFLYKNAASIWQVRDDSGWTDGCISLWRIVTMATNDTFEIRIRNATAARWTIAIWNWATFIWYKLN